MHIDIKKEIKSSNWGIAGIVIIATIIAVALFGPFFLPYKPLAQSTDIFLAPCAAHWLGTNHVGQDVFTQLVYGARTSLLVGFGVGILSTLLAIIFGVSTALINGIYDKIVMRIVDALLIIPPVIVIVLIAAYVKPSIFLLILIITLFSWQGGARVLRAQSLSLRERGHISAARMSGASLFYLARRHIIPDLGLLITVDFIYSVRRAVFMEAGLAFLGITDLYTVSWGMMMHDAMRFTYLNVWQWWLLPAGLALSLTIVGLTFIGHALEPIMEPRLRSKAVATT